MGNSNSITAKSKYDPDLALRICELIADGQTVTAVVAMPDMPSRPTLYRWLTLFPEFNKAYERAKQISAQSFEDELLDMARTLKNPNDFTSTKIKAYEVAMAQLRWSAARRDPDRYGQRNDQQTLIPIQINTSLNLGQEGSATPTASEGTVYTIKVGANRVPAIIDDDAPAAHGNHEPPTIDLTDEIPDNTRAFGVPETQRQELHRPPVGRPKGTLKGHKTAAQTHATKMAYAKRANNKAKRENENGDQK